MKVYMDNNATTAIAPEVKQTIIEALDTYGNASSIHSMGVSARNLIEGSRKDIADLIAAAPDEIIFTSGGSESDNIAIQGCLAKTDKKHIITSKIEHPAVLNVFKAYEKKGYDVTWLEVDENAVVSPESVEAALTEDTALVSIMLANNEVGTIQDITEIVKRVKAFSADIVVHSDAVQALGKLDLDVKKIGLDLASFSAHKLYGPKGVGALYVKKGLKLKSVYFGGGHERGLKPGTENTVFIAGFGAAARLASENMLKNQPKIKELRDRLKEGVLNKIENVQINGDLDKSLDNTVNISFKNVEGEGILMRLDMLGIQVSTGSACSSGTLEPSHVLLAMGVDAAAAQASMRFSLSSYNTIEEIDYTIEKLVTVISGLRELSPF